MPTVVPQARFRAPRNLDLTGVEGLGDAIEGIGKGLRRRRIANTLADLGIEAHRLEQSLAHDGSQSAPGSEGIGFGGAPDPDFRVQSAVLEAQSQFTPDGASNMDTRRAALIREAQIAIRRGASPHRVLQQLRRFGVDLNGVR